MHAASALSEHPLATHAVGECVGRLLESGGDGPDLLVVWATRALGGALEDVVRASRHLLRPATTLGGVVDSVLTDGREVEHHGALSMLAVWGDDPGASTRPRSLRLGTSGSPDGPRLLGGAALADATGTLLVLYDPFSTPGAPLGALVDRTAPGLTVLGGAVTAGRSPGGNLLVLDGGLHRDGAVAVHLPDTFPVTPVVAPSSSPIGPTLTVTAVDPDDGLLTGLGGRSATERLDEQLARLGPTPGVAAAGLRLARVLDDGGGVDAVQRLRVLGVDAGRGGLALDGEVRVGDAAQLELASQEAAVAHLEQALPRHRGVGGLVFASVERGHTWHGEPDREATVLSDGLGVPLAGGFLGGQLCPVAGRTLEQPDTVVVALFG